MNNKRKQSIPVLLLISCMILLIGAAPVQAADEGGRSDVWIDVIEKDVQQKISVTVPTTFAFVVNGTTDPGSHVSISVDNGTLLLPNVTISVLNPDSSTSDYQINVTGSTALPFKNYSTITAALTAAGEENYDPALREGAAVTVTGYIENVGAAALDRNYWNAVIGDDEVTIADENFKNYRINLESQAAVHRFNVINTGETNKIWLDQVITLEKPDGENGYDRSGLARIPAVETLALDVEIGGYRGQYSQIEQSVKAGKIIWTAEIIN